MNCSKCQLAQVIKYGRTHYGKQRFLCQDYGRQFVKNPSRQLVDETTQTLIDKLLFEILALAATARVTNAPIDIPPTAYSTLVWNKAV